MNKQFGDRVLSINQIETDEVVPGECLQGALAVSYTELVEALGEPFSVCDTRSDVGWWLEDPGAPGCYALIYNWKESLDSPEFADTRFWLVDGNDRQALVMARACLPSCGDLQVEAAHGPMRVDESISNGRFVNLVSGNGNTVSWVSYDGSDVAEEHQGAQARATARLFGSADDLVVVLRQLHAEWRREMWHDDRVRPIDCLVEAVLHKATGRGL